MRRNQLKTVLRKFSRALDPKFQTLTIFKEAQIYTQLYTVNWWLNIKNRVLSKFQNAGFQKLVWHCEKFW